MINRAWLFAALLAILAGRAAAHEGADTVLPLRAAPSPAPVVSAAEPNSKTSTRAERLEQAEALLAGGEVMQALAAYEVAASQEHAADIEMGLMRSQMQAGQYQHALAMAAHAASEHLDNSQGAVVYVWLLYLGGQQAYAKDILQQAKQRLPGDRALAWLSSHLQEGVSQEGVGQPSVSPPIERLAPYALGEPVPKSARVTGGAVLLAGGKQAIAPLANLNQANGLWLRNGLGRTVRARVIRSNSGLALMELDHVLDEPDSVLASNEAFPGSPACAFGYPSGSAREGAWPRARLGFLGRRAASADILLGIDLPSGTQGGPVIDLKGRLVGITLPPGEDGKPHLAGISALRALTGEPPTPADLGASNRPLDVLYEQAMRLALQVIAAP